MENQVFSYAIYVLVNVILFHLIILTIDYWYVVNLDEEEMIIIHYLF